MKVALHVVAFVFALYIAVPLYWIVMNALKSNTNIVDSFGFWFQAPFSLFSNLGHLFSYQNGLFGRWMLNTVLYAGGGAALGTTVAALAAFVLAKHQFAGRRAALAIILMSFAIPGTALVVPLYLLFTRLHLINNPLGMILPALGSGFSVLLMYVYIRAAIADEVLEAARIDGAGEFRIFWQIGVPLMLPGCASVVLFAVVGIWNNYFLPLLIFSNDRLYPLTVGLQLWNSDTSTGDGHNVLYALIVTGGIVSIIPTVALFLLLQRYWRAGLSLGALRG